MKKMVLLALIAATVVSCRQKDEYDYSYDEKVRAENALGFAIPADQTWEMESEVSVRVKNVPAGFTDSLIVFSADPLADSTATIIASTSDISSVLTFSNPSYLSTLYAGCVSNDGNYRVVPFSVAEGVADFDNLIAANEKMPAGARRAGENVVLPHANELNWDVSENTKLGLADWNDSIATITGAYTVTTLEAPLTREYLYNLYNGCYGSNDVDRLLHFDQTIRSFYYATVAESGSEITVTPIGTNGTNNAKMCFGYFYFDKGQAHNVKTVRKYLFGEVYNGNTKFDQGCNTYKLVYYDANGNPSYTFPEGTEIGFFCRCVNVNECAYPLEWYAEGQANNDLSNYMTEHGYSVHSGGSHDWWIDANHVIMFSRNGQKLIGFEDWISNFNMKDVVLHFVGNVKDFPEMSKINNLPNHHIYTFAFEDTKNGDYDLNDVVLQVFRKNNGFVVKLVALGAMDPLKAYFKDSKTGEVKALFGGKELHEVFGQKGDYHFVNTEAINNTKVTTIEVMRPVTAEYGQFSMMRESLCAQDFFIVNERTGDEIHTPTSQHLTGTAPYGLCIPHLWAWPKERVSVITAYPRFKEFGSALNSGRIDATDWYVSPADGKTLFHDFGM